MRYKLACTSDDTRIWGRGGLSNALDSVITKVRGSQYMDSRHHPVTTQLRETAGRTPGVVVIDGWWTPGRLDTDRSACLTGTPSCWAPTLHARCHLTATQ